MVPSLEYNAGISWYNEYDPRTALILFEKIKYTIETYFYVIIKNSIFLCFVLDYTISTFAPI